MWRVFDPPIRQLFASTLSPMSLPSEPTLAHHTSAEAARLMDELCEVYADAYGAVAGEDIHQKSVAFRERDSGPARSQLLTHDCSRW